jgi:hypothetical protein
VLPVFLQGVNIGEDAGVSHRQLEPVIKIATDDGSGPLREILLQELRKECTAEEDRVPTPPLECGEHQGGSAFDKSSDQGPNRVWREEGMVHGSEEDGGGFVR